MADFLFSRTMRDNTPVCLFVCFCCFRGGRPCSWTRAACTLTKRFDLAHTIIPLGTAAAGWSGCFPKLLQLANQLQCACSCKFVVNLCWNPFCSSLACHLLARFKWYWSHTHVSLYFPSPPPPPPKKHTHTHSPTRLLPSSAYWFMRSSLEISHFFVCRINSR